MTTEPKSCPIVARLEAYVPGEQPREAGWIKLNTNESPYPVPHTVNDAIIQEVRRGDMNKYPDPTASALREALGELVGVPPTQILVGNGSDEVLRLLCHAYLDPAADDKIGMLKPTYSLYSVLAEMFGSSALTYPVLPPDYKIPTDAISSPAKLFFLANPNPPLGTAYPAEEVRRFASQNPARIIVVDEAYVDFSESDIMPVYHEFPNVVVTRTFSKSYSMAGMRIGYVIAREKIIAELAKVKDSYNVNRLTQVAALAAVRDRAYFLERAKTIIDDREFLAAELSARGFAVTPSRGNFLFARHAKAPWLYQQLKERRILVRYFTAPELADGLRISIGTHAELEQLLATLDELLA